MHVAMSMAINQPGIECLIRLNVDKVYTTKINTILIN